MKKALPILLVLAVIAAGVFVFIAKSKPAGAAVAFELKFKVGQVDKYRVGMDLAMNAPNMPKGPGSGVPTSMNMNVSALMTQKVEAINPDGSAKIKYTFSDLKVASPLTPPGAVPPTQKGEFTATVTKDGTILKIEDVTGSAGNVTSGDSLKVANQMMAICIPKTAVSVGSTWDSKIEIPGVGESVLIQSTLEKDNEPMGKDKASQITSKLSYEGDIADLIKKATAKSGSHSMPPDIKGKVVVDGTSTCYFNRIEGKMLKGNVNAKIAVDVELPAQMVGTRIQPKQHLDVTITGRINKAD